MTNIEKSKELSHDYFLRGQLGFASPDSESAGYECATKMAEWKDEQFSTQKQTLIDNAKYFLVEYFWEHPHEKSVIQSDEFTSIDDMLEKFENRIRGGNNEK